MRVVAVLVCFGCLTIYRKLNREKKCVKKKHSKKLAISLLQLDTTISKNIINARLTMMRVLFSFSFLFVFFFENSTKIFLFWQRFAFALCFLYIKSCLVKSPLKFLATRANLCAELCSIWCVQFYQLSFCFAEIMYCVSCRFARTPHTLKLLQNEKAQTTL